MPYRKMTTKELRERVESLLNDWREHEEDNHRLLREHDLEGAYNAQKAAKASFEEYLKAKAELDKRA